jgi:hypothetical protein
VCYNGFRNKLKEVKLKTNNDNIEIFPESLSFDAVFVLKFFAKLFIKKIFIFLISFFVICFFFSVIENDYTNIFDNLFQKIFLFLILFCLFKIGMSLNKKLKGVV